MSLTLKEIRDKVDGSEMDLSLMSIVEVPVKEIASITKIRKLDLSCNQIVRLPDNFAGFLNHIVDLDLSKNQVIELPQDIHKMASLQHLDLYQNKLKSLPVNFSKLKSLKWLDLKDNPLDEKLQKAVGGCLDDQQCKKCAESVVAYFRTVSSDMERKKQEMLRKEREQEAIRKKEEEAEALKLKEKKKMVKEARRKEWEEMQKSKETQNKKRKHSEESIEQETDSEEETVEPEKSSWLMSFGAVMVTALVAVVACSLGIYYYCKENFQNRECQTVNNGIMHLQQHSQNFLQRSLEFCRGLLDTIRSKVSGLLTWMGY